ncbi:MAG: hypothetical protein A3F69_02400 [Acidobacteria bacterium RIFCSPLOWO2_12_FULL_66_10]|nr:MAG: hypothetical protein A3F69_02400 [Acidobacteria bacterium RIFCSPLOWO2_12_FULL_66_10]
MALRRGDRTMVTVKLHDEDRSSTSLAVQVTSVVSTGKLDPLGAVQTAVTGGRPPAVVGAS